MFSEDYDLGLEEIVEIAMHQTQSRRIVAQYHAELKQSTVPDAIWTASTNWLRDIKIALLDRLRYSLFVTPEEYENMEQNLAPLGRLCRKTRSLSRCRTISTAYRDPRGLWALDENEFNKDFPNSQESKDDQLFDSGPLHETSSSSFDLFKSPTYFDDSHGDAMQTDDLVIEISDSDSD